MYIIFKSEDVQQSSPIFEVKIKLRDAISSRIKLSILQYIKNPVFDKSPYYCLNIYVWTLNYN